MRLHSSSLGPKPYLTGFCVVNEKNEEMGPTDQHLEKEYQEKTKVKNIQVLKTGAQLQKEIKY